MALPPHCYICKQKVFDRPGELLVDFQYEVPAKVGEVQQKLGAMGWTGHGPLGSKWFCARHAPEAEKRTGMPLAQALAELRAIAALEARRDDDTLET